MTELSQTITTRVATRSDEERITDLLTSYREEMGGADKPPSSFSLSDQGPLFMIIAERGSELAGVIAAQHCHSFMHAADLMLLTDIYVPGPFRRQGVAKALIDRVRELALELGCESMSLVVANINNAALVTAARSGFSKQNDLLLTQSLT